MVVYDLYSLLNLLLVVSPTLISEAAAGCGPGYYYNASGSVEIPFPQPPSSSPSDPSGNYTLFTHVTFPGPRGLNQSFGAVNASGYPLLDIPLDYQGCLFTWNGSPFPATQDHVNVPNNSSCQAALSQDCIDSIVESASGQANQLSRENQAGGGECWIPSSSKCGKFVTGFSAGFFQASEDPLPKYPSNESDCLAGLGFISSIAGYEDGHKLSTYFKKLDKVTPIMLMAWNNASSNPDGKPWSDVRFLCMSTDKIMPGSKSGASSSMRLSWAGCIWGLVGVVGLSAFMM